MSTRKDGFSNRKKSSGKPNTGAGKAPAGSRKEGQKTGRPAGASNRNQPAAGRSKATTQNDEIRLNKYIANAGVCSRRDADIYIQSGNVKVNGNVITEMGYRVQPGDLVNFDGTIITPEKKEYILLNKPKNFTTGGEDQQAERHVLELLRGATKARIAPVGRMDKNTTGLLLFTNDTDLIRKFGLPNQKSSKIYHVSLSKNLKFEDLEKMASGVTIEGHRLAIEEISYIENEPKTEIGIKLKTANVKVVRSIFEQFDYDVLRIDRVSFAGLTKKNLPRGHWRFLSDQEIINLKNI